MTPHRHLFVAALVCVAVNGLASIAMAGVIRHGVPPVDHARRVAFLRSHRTEWRAAWLVWPVAAITLVVFFARLRSVLAPEDGAITAIALLVAAAGTVPDISAEMIYILRYPLIAERPTGLPGVTLEQMDGTCALLTGLLGNGAYTIAWILLSTIGARTPGYPRALVWGSVPGILAGLALCVAAGLNHPMGMTVSTMILMPAFLLWCASAGLWARRYGLTARKESLG